MFVVLFRVVYIQENAKIREKITTRSYFNESTAQAAADLCAREVEELYPERIIEYETLQIMHREPDGRFAVIVVSPTIILPLPMNVK